MVVSHALLSMHRHLQDGQPKGGERCSEEVTPTCPAEVGAADPAAEKDSFLPFRVSCKVCTKLAQQWLPL